MSLDGQRESHRLHERQHQCGFTDQGEVIARMGMVRRLVGMVPDLVPVRMFRQDAVRNHFLARLAPDDFGRLRRRLSRVPTHLAQAFTVPNEAVTPMCVPEGGRLWDRRRGPQAGSKSASSVPRASSAPGRSCREATGPAAIPLFGPPGEMLALDADFLSVAVAESPTPPRPGSRGATSDRGPGGTGRHQRSPSRRRGLPPRSVRNAELDPVGRFPIVCRKRKGRSRTMATVGICGGRSRSER